MLLSLTLLAGCLVLLLAGLRELLLARRAQLRLAQAVVPEDAASRALLRWSVLDRALRETARGRALETRLAVSGVSLSPARFLAAGLAISVVLGLLLGSSLSALLFPVGVAAGIQATRLWLRRQQSRRREAFIAQMPDLARTLSNATSAGLSVRTALALAADELAEPAHSELMSVTEQLNLGTSLDSALIDLERRLPSREVAILVSTLVVSARSGGGLVGALRDIATTLETRKEVRREIRTTYAQALTTGYAVLGMGVMVLFLLDRINPGTVDIMLRNPIGQVALLIAGGVYALGIIIMRRMTRVEV